MTNELVHLQMRKMGYNKAGREGVKYADREYEILRWFQDLYDANCLNGTFYTSNIIHETWNVVCRSDDPLNSIEKGYENIINQAKSLISERWG